MRHVVAGGLLESIFQPIVQACGSFGLVVTFDSLEYKVADYSMKRHDERESKLGDHTWL